MTSKQLEELNKGNEVFPDEYSGRFGLRLGSKEAVDRAQYFMDWTPEGLKGEHHQKDYAVMEMEVFALGYFVKVESGILEKTTREAPTPTPKIISVSGAKNEPKRSLFSLLVFVMTIFPF